MKYKTFSHLFSCLIKKNISSDVKDARNDTEMGEREARDHSVFVLREDISSKMFASFISSTAIGKALRFRFSLPVVVNPIIAVSVAPHRGQTMTWKAFVFATHISERNCAPTDVRASAIKLRCHTA